MEPRVELFDVTLTAHYTTDCPEHFFFLFFFQRTTKTKTEKGKMEEIMKGRQEELSLDFTTAVRSCLAVLRTPYTNYKKLKTTLLTCPRSSQNWSQLSSSAALHWLPIDSWIQYKLASLCYSGLKPDCPWLPDWTWVYKPTWQLRSSFDTSILCLPSVCMHSLGQRPFFFCNITCKIMSSNTLTCFKSSLKSHLFKLSY